MLLCAAGIGTSAGGGAGGGGGGSVAVTAGGRPSNSVVVATGGGGVRAVVIIHDAPARGGGGGGGGGGGERKRVRVRDGSQPELNMAAAWCGRMFSRTRQGETPATATNLCGQRLVAEHVGVEPLLPGANVINLLTRTGQTQLNSSQNGAYNVVRVSAIPPGAGRASPASTRASAARGPPPCAVATTTRSRTACAGSDTRSAAASFDVFLDGGAARAHTHARGQRLLDREETKRTQVRPVISSCPCTWAM
eukprot:SAG25_NODE_256_length_10933_cov_24.263522_10_plen_250_part_00